MSMRALIKLSVHEVYIRDDLFYVATYNTGREFRSLSEVTLYNDCRKYELAYEYFAEFSDFNSEWCT